MLKEELSASIFHVIEVDEEEHEFEVFYQLYEDNNRNIFQICSESSCKEICHKVPYPIIKVVRIEDVTDDIDEHHRIVTFDKELLNVLTRDALDIVVREIQFPEVSLCSSCFEKMEKSI